MYDNEMEVRFLSCSVNESLGRVVAAAFVSQMNPTLEELTDVRTAVSEAVTNAIIHGYDNAADQTVVLKCYAKERELTVVVEDRGHGIENVDLARQPFYTSKPNLDRSGMGFSVMEAFMDSVDVVSAPGTGTVVTMRKLIRGAEKAL